MGRARQGTIVVVGNGGAAVHACMALRSCGHGGRIVMVGDHLEQPYNPMLTPYYVAGRIARDACFPFESGLLGALDVDVRLGTAAVSLDAIEHTVTLARGLRLEYENCLVASGASPVVPPIPGLEGPDVFVLRTMADADRLRRALETGAGRALVLGASMVGLKVTEVLSDAGVQVVLADVARHVLPLAADETCAGLMEAHMSAAGVDLRLGTRLISLAQSSRGLVAEFHGGETAAVDLVVVAAGVQPNLDFIDPGQVDIDVGLLVDEHMRTTASGVYAAGDVAQAVNVATGGSDIVGLWANACLQGRTAGRNMAGVPEAYPGSLSCNIIHAIDMTFAGVAGAPAEALTEMIGARAGTYCRLTGDENGPAGFNLLNDCIGAGIVRHAVAKSFYRRAGLSGGALHGPWLSGGALQSPWLSGGRFPTDLRVPQRAWAGFCDRLVEYAVSGAEPRINQVKEGA